MSPKSEELDVNDKSGKFENEPWREVFTSQEIFGSPKNKRKYSINPNSFENAHLNRAEIKRKLHPNMPIETSLNSSNQNLWVGTLRKNKYTILKNSLLKW